MRQIAVLPANSVQRFADHLLTLRIEVRLQEEPDGVAVWICDEDQVARARAELDAFQANPSDPRYGGAASVANTMRQQEDEEEQEYRQRQSELNESMEHASDPPERPLTIALVAISVVAALATNFTDPLNGTTDTLRIASANATEALEEVWGGQLWRLITPVFLHFGLIHLVFNMMMLLSLGGRIEGAKGTPRFLGLFLLLAVGSNLAEYWMSYSATSGLTFGMSSNFGGMSGVVYGLFGYAWMKARYEPELEIEMPMDTVVVMLGWFVLCVAGFMDTATSRVANVGHASGLLLGILLGGVPAVLRKKA